VLAGDLTAVNDAREELTELEDSLDDLASATAGSRHREKPPPQLLGRSRNADLHVGYDDAVAAADTIIDYLEQHPNVLTRVDTVGWYDGPELILQEPD
jgi:hypothetical protein